MKNDRTLLTGARNFKQSALEEIYNLYSDKLFQFAYRQLGSRDTAEDCAASTFEKFLNILQRGGGPDEHLRAYLYRIAQNWINDYYRKLPKDIELEEPELEESQGIPPEQQLSHLEEVDQIREALQMLTSNQRQVITLKFLEGWNNKDIAELMDKPIGSIKALQYRGLISLRGILSSGFVATEKS